jgi:predicted flap endonuclease-1-like 5' DNA nuclease
MQLLTVATPPEAASVSPWMLLAAVALAVGGGVLGWIARRAVERSARRDVKAYESELVRASHCARDRALEEKGDIEERYSRVQREHASCSTQFGGMQGRLQARDDELENLAQQLTAATREREHQAQETEQLRQRLTDVESAYEERAKRDGAPEWLRSTPDGPSDDLTTIRGLGPVTQERLNALGVFHFSQLAQMTAENASWIALRIHIVPGRLMRDRWAEQAQMLQSAAD